MNRYVASLTAAASVLVLAAACQQPGQTERQKEPTTAAPNAGPALAPPHTMPASPGNAIAEEETKFDEMREDYVQNRRVALINLDGRLLELEAKAHTLTGKRRAETQKQLGAIRSQREAFAVHLQSLGRQSQAEWNGAKARVDKDWDELESSVDKVKD